MPGEFLHPVAQAVQRLIIQLGLGNEHTSVTWPVFFGGEPSTPDNIIRVADTDGKGNGREMVTGERQGLHGFQVLVRSNDYATAAAKAWAIATAFDTDVYDTSVTVAGTTTYRFHHISRVTDPLYINKDIPESKRPLFTVNCLASIRKVTA